MKIKTYKIIANADAIGIHEGTLTKRLKTGDLKAGTLVCFDTDSSHIKACPIDKTPWGVAQQDAMMNDIVSIQPLTSCAQTARIILSGDVQAGQLICLADQGQAQALPTNAGTYKIIGLALTDGQNNEKIEALTTLPHNIEIQ